ncbi:tetratricopeptide repeat protein [Chryseobacterium shandongense]|uniref:Tetratricopeptide repeat protein n=1 Tax=Chryseobacterium shandongense TaxID=1493872 RepID=A0AAD1DP25_9FLAO|nr:tetratricopeptide repeat protein [Chryseobacterium shandongense]AZA88114.1 tetratricopeptide repeat protein [Chryseobacterium shandongense]AZA96675.1 tetratricopeptide repeat protein [Chryseobacterium shandongense]
MSNNRTKFGFQIGDNFHTIVSVHENNSGELIINPSSAENYSEIEFGNPNAEKKIKAQHYTVHNSRPESEEIVLNHTLEYEDGSKTNTRIYTRAFKRDLYCPVLQVRGQDFSIDRYKSQKKSKYKYISLGDYNPNVSTLYYMIVLCNPGFTLHNDFPDLNVTTIHFQKYSFSILWSYNLIRSHSTGKKTHFLTVKDIETQIKEGFSQEEIINLYRLTREIQHQSFISFLQKEFPEDINYFTPLKGIGFKKSSELSLDDNDKNSIILNHGYEAFVLGRKAQEEGLRQDALKLFEISADIFKAQKKVIAYAETLNSKGIIFQILGHPNKSIACYQEALGIYRKYNLDFNIAITKLNLSIVYRDTGDFTSAIELAMEALKISSSQYFTSLEAHANMELGTIYKNLKELKKAFDFLNTALVKYKEDHNRTDEAFCLGNIGLIRVAEGKFLESLNLHDQALDIFTSLDNKSGIANEVANVGNMNCVLGNFELGLTQLKLALEGHTSTGYQYGIATDLKLIGVHLANKGEHNEAKQFLEKSRDILLRIENYHGADQVSHILSQLG